MCLCLDTYDPLTILQLYFAFLKPLSKEPMNMDIFHINKCNFFFSRNELIHFRFSHRLGRSSSLFLFFQDTRFLFKSTRLQLSTLHLYSLQIIQHVVCVRNYVSDYFKVDILQLQAVPRDTYISRAENEISQTMNHKQEYMTRGN